MSTRLRSWMMVLMALLALSCGLLTGDDDETPAPTPTSAGQPKDATATPRPTPTVTESEDGAPQLLASLPGGAREILYVAGDAVWVALTDVDAVLIDLATGEERTRAVGHLVGVDGSGRSWLLSQDGSAISVWKDDDWITYSENAGWTPADGPTFNPTLVSELVTGPAGQVWLAPGADVRSFDGSRWQIHTLDAMGMSAPEGDLLMEFTLLFAESTNEVWVGECTWGGPGPFGGQGVRRFDGQRWLGADAPLTGLCVTALAEDAAGGWIWVGDEDALWRYDPGMDVWDPFPAPEIEPEYGTRYGFVSDLVIGPGGEPWPTFAACGGASCYGAEVHFRVHTDGWTQVGTPDEFVITRLYFDESGAAWIVPWRTAGPVSRVTGDGQTQEVATIAPTVRAIEDGGTVWVVTQERVHRLAGGSMEEVAAWEETLPLDAARVQGELVLLAEMEGVTGLWRLPVP